MVDVRKLRVEMMVKGYSQKSLVAEINARGKKMSENTFSSKMNGRSQFDCDDADVICEILKIEDAEKKADIFLANPSHIWDY